MVLEPLVVWKQELAKVAPSSEIASAAFNIANWYTTRINSISVNPSFLIASSFKLVFPTPVFQAELLNLKPVSSAVEGAKQFANAWETALTATTVLVAAGSAIPPPTPPTTFSVVLGTVIDPPSIALGKTKLLELAKTETSAIAFDSKFSDIFYEATNLLTITVTGLSSAPGNPPLVASSVPLI